MESLQKLTVMYVENDPKVQLALGQHLKTIFSNVAIFSSTLEALKQAKKIKPNILVTNINHQRVSGIDLIKALKQFNPNLEALILSSCNDKKMIILALRLEVVDFLEKPFEHDSVDTALLKAHNRIVQKQEFIELKRQSLEEQITDKDNISKIFKMLKRDEIPVDVINFYKGVPIINTGYIKEVKDENIFLQTQSLQKLVMNLEKFINVESSVLPKPIMLDVSDITSFSEPVKVNNPKVKNFSVRRRKDIRLLPDEKFTLSLHRDNQEIKVKVSDVSTELITYKIINIEDKDLLDEGITIDTKLIFILDKDGEIELNFKSEIKIIKRGEKNIIYAIKPLLEGQDKEDLNQYILQREFQIISELKNLRLVNGL